jgi:hypothetical protein
LVGGHEQCIGRKSNDAATAYFIDGGTFRKLARQPRRPMPVWETARLAQGMMFHSASLSPAPMILASSVGVGFGGEYHLADRVTDFLEFVCLHIQPSRSSASYGRLSGVS